MPEISEKISVLIVDDSPVFQSLLHDLLQDYDDIEIVGEAQNGIEALDQILRKAPQVILMDFEMPLMDGMTALQHLMVHRPTPTILLSSLTAEGSVRSFDTLKNGAVDFICKDVFLQDACMEEAHAEFIAKIRAAAKMRVSSQTVLLPDFFDIKPSNNEPRKIAFCEECGNRQVVETGDTERVICKRCGDTIILSKENRLVASNCVSVFVGGAGAFKNLLTIIPAMNKLYAGALVCVIDAPSEHIDIFTEYLAAIAIIPVHRAGLDTTIEGGACYIFSVSEGLCLKPYSATLKLQKLPELTDGIGPIDVMLASAAKILKDKACAVILSGKGGGGLRGLEQIRRAGGRIFPMASSGLLYGELCMEAIKKYQLHSFDKERLIEDLQKHHSSSNNPKLG